MTVKRARVAYAVEARSLMRMLRDHAAGWIPAPPAECGPCSIQSQYVDAASLAYDAAVSIEHPSPPDLWRYIGCPSAGVA